MTKLGEEATVMKTDDGKLLTCVKATTAGLDQLDGTTTVAGTVTNELTATETTALEGTEAITEVGTDSGMFVQETIATDGDEATTTTNEAESDETHEIGTACGLDHVLGIVTVAGASTKLLTAT
jgi:hypothetical protein